MRKRTDRADGRSQDERAKARAKRLLCLLIPDEELTPRRVGRRAATRVPCSCPMCGQARKMDGPRVNERRAADAVDPSFD